MPTESGPSPADLQLTLAQRKVLDHLLFVRDRRNQATISYRNLSKRTGIPRSTVQRCLRQLSAFGLIVRLAGDHKTTGAHALRETALALHRPAKAGRA